MCWYLHTHNHVVSHANFPRRSRHEQFTLIAKGKFKVKWSLTWFVDKHSCVATCVCVRLKQKPMLSPQFICTYVAAQLSKPAESAKTPCAAQLAFHFAATNWFCLLWCLQIYRRLRIFMNMHVLTYTHMYTYTATEMYAPNRAKQSNINIDFVYLILFMPTIHKHIPAIHTSFIYTHLRTLEWLSFFKMPLEFSMHWLVSIVSM